MADKGGGKSKGETISLDGHFDFELEELARELGGLLRERGRIVTAESCTGGWLAAAITAVSGSSNWFALGVNTYSNDAKKHLLSVPAATLQKHGAVSRETVRSMAKGALGLDSGALLGVAISGVAGPGSSGSRSAGTVWIAWALRGRTVHSENFVFSGSRNQVRRSTVLTALRGCIRVLG